MSRPAPHSLRVIDGVAAGDPASVLPLSIVLDDSDSPADILDALMTARFAVGEHPAAQTANLQRLRADAPLLPEGAQVLRTAREERRTAVLAAGEGWLLQTVRWPGHACVTVTAVTPELAESVLAETIREACEPPSVDEDVVTMGFWHQTERGPSRRSHDIASPGWADIRRNYAAAAAGALDALMGVDPASLHGRIMLLHGPPGTGKTTALRALARAWRSWCQLDCVLDPERLFGDPAYLLKVALGEQDAEDAGDGTPPRWRLLLLEDCDELIRGEAKQSTGQALSRLLNLTDGLLGQGCRVLVGITTNEDLAVLHPAVTRPGRCLAQIAVEPLSAAEAADWLGTTAGIGPRGATLAELYALRTDRGPVTADADPGHVGLYL